jgi:hypothetical protein
MLKVKLKNLFWISIALFSATQFCSAQSSDDLLTGELPSSHPGVAVPNSENDLTMAGEYKSNKEVVQQEKPVCFNVYFEGGYTSEYMFRGTDLMPDSDGGGFLSAQLSKWGFTLGAWGINQFGTASAPSWSMGESGGGAAAFASIIVPPPPLPPLFIIPIGASPHTVQNNFDEVDLFLEYHKQFLDGWIDVTVGNLVNIIDRTAQTSFDATFTVPTGPLAGETVTRHFQAVGDNTVQDETFDRLYVSLSTSKIPYVTPKITYYQTVYSDGSEPNTKRYFDPNFWPSIGLPQFGGPLTVSQHVQERNDALGGYLEGRLNGHFPIIPGRIDFDPYGVISVSFHDRTEPVDNPQNLRDIIRGRTLSGFNHAEIGIDIPIVLLHWIGTSTVDCAPPEGRLRLVPFGRYAYHISEPNPGTNRDEWWGGAKLTLSF